MEQFKRAFKPDPAHPPSVSGTAPAASAAAAASSSPSHDQRQDAPGGDQDVQTVKEVKGHRDQNRDDLNPEAQRELAQLRNTLQNNIQSSRMQHHAFEPVSLPGSQPASRVSLRRPSPVAPTPTPPPSCCSVKFMIHLSSCIVSPADDRVRVVGTFC